MAQQLERGSSLYIVAAALAVLHHSRPQNSVRAQLPWTEPQFNQFLKTNHVVQASRAITMVHKQNGKEKLWGQKNREAGGPEGSKFRSSSLHSLLSSFSSRSRSPFLSKQHSSRPFPCSHLYFPRRKDITIVGFQARKTYIRTHATN